MTVLDPWRAARPRRGRARRVGRVLTSLVALAVAFAAGLAVGQALEEGPLPSGTRTFERTLPPVERPPAGGPRPRTATDLAP